MLRTSYADPERSSTTVATKETFPSVLALLVGLTVLAVAPALPFLTTRVIGDGGDAYQFVGFQYVAQRLIAAGEFPFGWTDFWRYPHGIRFQNTYDSSLLVLIGLPLYALG